MDLPHDELLRRLKIKLSEMKKNEVDIVGESLIEFIEMKFKN